MDIGGIGFGPDATDVFMEGLYIPMLKLADSGKLNETLIAMIRANTRLPVDTDGDVYSLANCNDVGCRRLVEMMDEFGLDNLDRLADHICDRSRDGRAGRDRQAAEGHLVEQHDHRRLRRADHAGRHHHRSATRGIHVDYTGTSPPSRRGINVPMAYTTAYTVFGLGCVVASRIPNNAGSLAPLTVSAPRRHHPQRAEAAARARPPHHRPDAARHGVRLPAPGDPRARAGRGHLVPVEHHAARPDWRQLRGNYGFATTFTSNGGTGARPTTDGLSATAYPSGVKGTPVEIAEQIMPLIFWRKEFRRGFRRRRAHARRPRPGDRDRERASAEPFELLAAFDRIDHPPRGRDGGQQRRARLRRPQVRQEAQGQGLPADPRRPTAWSFGRPVAAGIGNPQTRDAERDRRRSRRGARQPSRRSPDLWTRAIRTDKKVASPMQLAKRTADSDRGW